MNINMLNARRVHENLGSLMNNSVIWFVKIRQPNELFQTETDTLNLWPVLNWNKSYSLTIPSRDSIQAFQIFADDDFNSEDNTLEEVKASLRELLEDIKDGILLEDLQSAYEVL